LGIFSIDTQQVRVHHPYAKGRTTEQLISRVWVQRGKGLRRRAKRLIGFPPATVGLHAKATAQGLSGKLPWKKAVTLSRVKTQNYRAHFHHGQPSEQEESKPDAAMWV